MPLQTKQFYEFTDFRLDLSEKIFQQNFLAAISKIIYSVKQAALNTAFLLANNDETRSKTAYKIVGLVFLRFERHSKSR